MVERVVYLGTDLQVIARIEGGATLAVRLQNAARTTVPEVGSPVMVKFEDGAARLLAD